jgi:antitoxin (DNA-binding transcriptional repressor) of toxin-antitoxin stability system
MRHGTEIRKLRRHLTAILRRVRGGEAIELTDGVAHPSAGGEVTQEGPLGRPLSRLPVTGLLTATEAIEEDRAHPGAPD